MNKDRVKIIGLRLKELRNQVGLSRPKIAELYNIPVNTIRTWEAGETEIGVIRLSEYLEIFHEYGFYVDLNNITKVSNNLNDSFDLALQKSSQVSLWLGNIARSQVLFYAQADGLVVYFNPKYKYILGNLNLSTDKIVPLSLNNIFNEDYSSKMLNLRTERIISIDKTVDNLSLSLKIELHPNLDSYNNLIGITAFVLSNPQEKKEVKLI